MTEAFREIRGMQNMRKVKRETTKYQYLYQYINFILIAEKLGRLFCYSASWQVLAIRPDLWGPLWFIFP